MWNWGLTAIPDRGVNKSVTTFLLIPGAGGDAWYWHRLIPELADRGHTGVAVELPADDSTAGLDRYAEVVVEAGHGRGDLVVVAQSLGGFTVPLVCDRLPVRQLVLLNEMIPVPGETAGAWWAATRHEMPSDFDVASHLFHDVPDEVKAVGLAGGKEQSDRPFADPWPLAAWPAVSTRIIVSTDDRFFPPDFQTRVARERLGIEPETMPGQRGTRPGPPAILEVPVGAVRESACYRSGSVDRVHTTVRYM